jgi:LCP family protein required for cell wall assembly
MAGNLLFWVFVAIFLLRIWSAEPMGESLTLATLAPMTEIESSEEDPPMTELEQTQESYQAEIPEQTESGTGRELIFLAAAIDYRGDDYLYGLADSIRLVRIDFDEPQINVVSLPRSLLVNVPTDRIQAQNPILLNQAYFYGTPGMQHYIGSGFGAGSLAETIQYNFGVSVNHYVVVDFQGFIQLVDILGGIEVDLPEEVDGRPQVYFPAGKQVLNGEEALQLARTRKNYTYIERMGNQDIILQALFRKLKSPLVIYRLPQIVDSLKDSIFTDVSPEQIMSLIFLLQRIDEQDIVYASPPSDVVVNDKVYIPSVDYTMQILRWDTQFIDWLYQSLWSSKE